MLSFQTFRAFWLVSLSYSQRGHVEKVSKSWKIVSTLLHGWIVQQFSNVYQDVSDTLLGVRWVLAS